MATTTNYGWETPDDTDLVKDGAAAIRTLGSSIDTTTKNLNPETTTGDIAYRSATANTNTRLAIGSTGQVLTVAAGVPSWASPSTGAMTLISSTALSGSSITLTSIAGTYRSLYLFVRGAQAGSDYNLIIEPNSTANNGRWGGGFQDGTSAFVNAKATLWSLAFYNTIKANNGDNAWSVQINEYASSTAYKPFQMYGGYYGGNNLNQSGIAGGVWYNTTAITSLKISTDSSTFSAGTVDLYGVK